MSSSKTKTVIIGISGPSSSGKTTVARLLRTILNFDAEPQNGVKGIRTFIVHEDDFYKNDDEYVFSMFLLLLVLFGVISFVLVLKRNYFC